MSVRTVPYGRFGSPSGGYLFGTSTPGDTPLAVGGVATAAGMVLPGIVRQGLMPAGRSFLRRSAPDAEAVEQGRRVPEIIGDGVAVLLFALGTLGATLHLPDSR